VARERWDEERIAAHAATYSEDRFANRLQDIVRDEADR
jgi:hypothetical protein